MGTTTANPMVKAPKIARSLLWVTIDGQRIDLPDPTKGTPKVEDVIEIIHNAGVGIVCEYVPNTALPALTIVGQGTTSLHKLKRAVETSLGNVNCVVYTRIDARTECIDCGAQVRREALDDHRGSLMCDAMKERAALKAQDYRRVGRAWKAIEKARVDMRWIPHGSNEAIDNKGEITNGTVDYVRVAPRWAVMVSEVTVVDHELRVVVLEHCRDHPAARRALIAALKLGPAKTRRTRANGVNTKDRVRMTEIFEDVLRTVGP